MSPVEENHTRAPSTRRGLRAVLVAKALAGVALAGVLGAGYWLTKTRDLAPGELANELRRGDTARFEWQSIDRKHWQAIADTPGESPEVTDAREGTSLGCPTGMVRVKGAFRRELNGGATGEVERLQDAACTDWISREFPARCRVFDREKIATEIAKLPTQPMDFCVDRFEYPNVLGQNPMIVATFREAEAVCKKNGKRLCTENEWTFACEGEEARPYPYGWTRDTTACVIDRAWRPFTEGGLQPRDGKAAREELDRLWQGEPSGSRGGCRSPFGVYDLTGNVDEWTRSVNAKGYRSILKGGYWGPVRARCRPATRAHNEDFVAYQQSFRCCAESNASVDAPEPVPPVASVVGDGGGLTTLAQGADAGPPRATVDLEAEWTPSSSDDELEALAKTRAARCSSAAGPAGASATGFALTTLALVAGAGRRRRRASP